MPAPPTAGLPAVRLPGHTTAPVRRQVRPTAAVHTTAAAPHQATTAHPDIPAVRAEEARYHAADVRHYYHYIK